MRNQRGPRVRYASRAPLGPPKKATNATAAPSARKPTMTATVAMRRASYWTPEMSGRPPSGGVSRLAAGALPAPEGGEDLAQARQRLVLRRALLVVDHEQPLGARAG